MTPGAGKAHVRSTLADLIAQYGLDFVKSQLAKVEKDPKWSEEIERRCFSRSGKWAPDREQK